MTSKDLVKKEEAALPVTSSYGDYSGIGFEGTQASDLSIPFLNLLQSNSPEVEDQLIDNAKPGQFLNSVTGELMDEVIFIPCHKEELWVEWVPRTKGGGFVGSHSPFSEVVQNAIQKNGGSRIPPKGADGKRVGFKHNGNELIESYYVYGLLLNPAGTEVESFAVASFSSTKIKPFRDWLTSMYLIKGKPPLFANRARLKTVKQKNDSGTYYNFSISPFAATWSASLINPETEGGLLEEAKQFREMVLSGVAKADLSQQSGEVAASPDTDSDTAPF